MNNRPKTSRPTNLLSIQENQVRKERPMTGFGLWRLGFRPFYLGAALFSSIAILLWLGALWGSISLPAFSSLNPISWHAHEMVFGFALAVIAGFLLTASNNWTGILPAAGLPLATLFSLWVAARYLLAADDLLIAAWADLAFVALLVSLLFRVLYLARLWKNFPILGLIILLGALNAWFYAIAILNLPINPLLPIELALLVILQLLVVMGGRVIPMFTQNGIPGICVWKPLVFVYLAPSVSILAIIGWITFPPRFAFLLCATASAVHCVRWLGWKPWKCLRKPMVWVLQLGYAWIPITFFLMGLHALDLVPRSVPMHALAVGAMGLIIAGMITRTAMGHTGRQIIATRIETAIFILIACSAILRVFAAIPAIQAPETTTILLFASGSLWAVAFLIYLMRYATWLFRPRLDGMPG